MSGVKFVAQKSGISHTGASAKITLAQVIAASNHRIKIQEIEVTINGDGATEAGPLIEVEFQTGGTLTTLTPVKENPSDDETLEVTAKHTSTVAPTSGNCIHSSYCHPTGGRNWKYHLEDAIQVPGGSILGVAVTSVDAHLMAVTIRGEE